MDTNKDPVRNMDTIRVGRDTDSNKLAGAIAYRAREQMKDNGSVALVIEMIGANAVNQGVKSLCVAKYYLTPDDITLGILPEFTDGVGKYEGKTAIRFRVYSMEV